MKTENIIGVLAILVSMFAVGCGVAPAAVGGAGDHTMAGGGAVSGATVAWAPPRQAPEDAPASTPDYVHRHGTKMSHTVVHFARR